MRRQFGPRWAVLSGRGTAVGRNLGACFQPAMLRFCAQESECSPQRRIALGLSQYSTESLTFLVAEDFLRARYCPRLLRL